MDLNQLKNPLLIALSKTLIMVPMDRPQVQILEENQSKVKVWCSLYVSTSICHSVT